MDLHRATVVLATVQRGASVDRVGWLAKLSGHGLRKSWKRRYCVLKSSVLFYFKSQHPDEPVAGMISLVDYQAVVVNPACRKSRWAFTLQPHDAVHGTSAVAAGAKPMHFYAENADYMDFWINSIASKLVRFESGSTLDALFSKIGYQPGSAATGLAPSPTPASASSSSSYTAGMSFGTMSPPVPRRSTLRNRTSQDSMGRYRPLVTGQPPGTSSSVASDAVSIESMTSGGTLSWDDRAMVLGTAPPNRSNSADAGQPTMPQYYSQYHSANHPYLLSPVGGGSGILANSPLAMPTRRMPMQSSARRLSTPVQELSRSRSSPFLHQVGSRPQLKLTVPDSRAFVSSDNEDGSVGTIDDKEERTRRCAIEITVPSSVRVRSSTTGGLRGSVLSPTNAPESIIHEGIDWDAGQSDEQRGTRSPIAEVASEFGIVLPPLPPPPPPTSLGSVSSESPTVVSITGSMLHGSLTPQASRSAHQHHDHKLSLEVMVQMVQEQLTLRSMASSSTESLPSVRSFASCTERAL